ncbi:MAG TPA: hypothetical protein ENK58_02715 [Desulfobacterales bacterium]|nr:hypothetical protein [Desulfobacterales bacterium]
MKKKLIEKLISIENEIAGEKGPFLLFGLFEREDSPNMWDIVVSSPWIDKNRRKTSEYIIDKINSELTPEEMITLSAVVVLYPTNDFVRDVTGEVDEVEHRSERLTNCVFNGITMKNAHIITSKNA